MKLSLNLAIVTLWIAFLSSTGARCEEVSSWLQGLEYVRLPPQLCKGTSAHLVGKLQNEQYSSAICDRQPHTYVFIQKLIGYSTTDKSIWKIINITQLPKLEKKEAIVQFGCRHLDIKSSTVLAIVKPIEIDNLIVVKAWRINLIREKLEEVDRRKVVCSM
jgi:hypothetical protein